MRRGASPTITFRIQPLHLAAMEREIEVHNRQPLYQRHTVSSFVQAAISEYIRKRIAGRRKGRKRASSAKGKLVATE